MEIEVIELKSAGGTFLGLSGVVRPPQIPTEEIRSEGGDVKAIRKLLGREDRTEIEEYRGRRWLWPWWDGGFSPLP